MDSSNYLHSQRNTLPKMDEWPIDKEYGVLLQDHRLKQKIIRYQRGNLLFQSFFGLGFLDAWYHSNGGPGEHLSDPYITDPSGSSKTWSHYFLITLYKKCHS